MLTATETVYFHISNPYSLSCIFALATFSFHVIFPCWLACVIIMLLSECSGSSSIFVLVITAAAFKIHTIRLSYTICVRARDLFYMYVVCVLCTLHRGLFARVVRTQCWMPGYLKSNKHSFRIIKENVVNSKGQNTIIYEIENIKICKLRTFWLK